jgi:hypothetical protein
LTLKTLTVRLRTTDIDHDFEDIPAWTSQSSAWYYIDVFDLVMRGGFYSSGIHWTINCATNCAEGEVECDGENEMKVMMMM